ncbi:MATE family efflux transporter [Jannaschia aquimarina]|uniref:DinF protein n=1 Tax=Jannaschia aquimarina TaxID=935700 RepID=A0A0D1DDV8_9RHOB|nr:MATE family efflux transporter [Jannaschia aquimarina]KIT18153.1 DNA-damage-inducible protein F [Jannaschia aquimarina]SNT30566.1 multidrug resistance protein, MATE family [Jannaschia aquimarina]
MNEAVPKGAPSHRRVLRIALPIVLSNATVPILGAVDTGVVGQMGEAAPIAAVGVGAIILTSVYWIFGFLRMGTTGLVAQALGKDEDEEVAALLTRALLIAGAAGAALILGQAALFAGAFAVSPATPEVEGMARDYMAIRIWSAPAAIAVYGLTGWLIAQERTDAVLFIQIGMNGMNIVLDLWFVLGLDWGVTGVAWATFLAEWSGAALGVWFCRDAFRNPAWRDRARVADPARLKRMVAVNGDILIRTLLLQATFTSFLLYGGAFGDVTLAANQVLLQFLYITAFAMDGFAFAVEALVGRYFGAGDRPLLRRSVTICSQWALATVTVLALAFALGGPALIDLMATDPETRQAARTFLPWMIAAPFLGVAAWMLDGVFIGATRTADMRNMMAVSAATYLVAALLLVPPFGNHGLWAALMISFVARGVTLGLRYPALERAALA